MSRIKRPIGFVFRFLILSALTVPLSAQWNPGADTGLTAAVSGMEHDRTAALNGLPGPRLAFEYEAIASTEAAIRGSFSGIRIIDTDRRRWIDSARMPDGDNKRQASVWQEAADEPLSFWPADTAEAEPVMDLYPVSMTEREGVSQDTAVGLKMPTKTAGSETDTEACYPDGMSSADDTFEFGSRRGDSPVPAAVGLFSLLGAGGAILYRAHAAEKGVRRT